MIYLSKKDKENICQKLEKATRFKLLNGYKNKEGREVHSVEYVKIINNLDEEKSDGKKIVITDVYITSRVWVKYPNESTGNYDISFRNIKPIEFIFDEETDEFNIINQGEIFFDNTQF